MNLASALFNRVLETKDFDTWTSIRKHYLPSEYYSVYEAISKHIDLYHELPTLENLKLEIRDSETLDKIYAIQSIDVETEPFLLLDYLKNEFTQKEALFELEKFVDKSIAFETAEETIDHLYEIISGIEEKVEVEDPQESMQSMNIFYDDEELDCFIPLGLNEEYDRDVRFAPTDYILIGGKRGSGKSLTCSNAAQRQLEEGKSVLYYTIEMPSKEILQRACSIATGVNHTRIRYKTTDNEEFEKVARWHASRYKNSEQALENYLKHRVFNDFHKELSKNPLQEVQLDIIYDPNLSLPKLKAEAVKRCKKLGNVGLIIVDYVNQVKKNSLSLDIYDWKDQIFVSKSLKSLAQVLEVPVLSPYQIDKDGEARMAKGILDSADVAYTLEAGPESIEFTCTKMRGNSDKINFTSATDWSCLRIGPHNGIPISEKQEAQVEEHDLGGVYEV